MEEIIARKYRVVSGVLNERQRRLWAASETLSLGHGGISIVVRATGISRVTITQNIRELCEEQSLPAERIRRPGGGRKKVANFNPH